MEFFWVYLPYVAHKTKWLVITELLFQVSYIHLNVKIMGTGGGRGSSVALLYYVLSNLHIPCN